MNKKELGRYGEELAATYLEKKGYQIIARNHLNKHGEIDIIALDNRTLVFVEVKTRSQLAYGAPAESVTYKKQQKLRELALRYLQQHQKQYVRFRFDVCSVIVKQGKPAEILHIPSAF